MRDARPWRQLTALAGTLGIMGVATLAALVFRHDMPISVIALLFIVAVLVVAFRFALAYAIASAVIAVVVVNVLFVHPRGGLQVDSAEHGWVLVALLLVSLVASVLSARLRADARRARVRARHAMRLRDLAAALGVATDTHAMTALVLAHLRRRFGQAVIALGQAPTPARGAVSASLTSPVLADVTFDGDLTHEANALSDEAMRECLHSGVALGRGTGRWMNLRATCVPMSSKAGVLGAVGVTLDDDDMAAAVGYVQSVADMLAAALQRARSAADALHARSQAESQALRNTLLASVAHDFRTPLATIIGAASSLAAQHSRLASADVLDLAQAIEQEARYLADITDNTLQWVRLSRGGPPAHLDWQSVDDLLGPVIQRARQQHPARHIYLRITPELPLVRADAVLLAQALHNLLDNAMKYSSAEVVVSAACQHGQVVLDVADRGPALDAQERERIFETFYRAPQVVGVRGAGLGLAITRAVAQAHGGQIDVLPRIDGGNVFRLSLPIPPTPPTFEDTP